ncbi:hypothetical protein ACWGH8_37340 [Nonomuraea muscovyensis]|uniref:Uncharacterized protein n=1 Tax=Nonomuraea muscovyensis TaxID=1124761 RepID=A0A7X0C0L0_9ACTN|nr:hypothetical protein [Nonomuraea muscovyensis]MBB6346222.1 hypothetical protein [Nonomuraea muscovyensis]
MSFRTPGQPPVKRKSFVGLAAGIIGFIASVLAIVTFLGVSSVKDIIGATPSPSSGSSHSAQAQPITPDRGTDDTEATDLVVTDGDRACGKVLERVDEMNRLSGSDAATFHPWAKKVLELRKLLLRRWRSATADLPDDMARPMRKIWDDYSKANWAWSNMTAAIGRYDWKTASAYLDMYRKYDDSAIKLANDLGFSSCNYTWPRPSGL